MLVLDLAKAFERVTLPVVLAWATHFNSTRNKGDGVVQLSGGEVSAIFQKKRSGSCRQRGNIGVDLRTRAKQLGAKEKARRRKCDVRFSIARRNRAFQKNED